jgi:hypothetical protein
VDVYDALTAEWETGPARDRGYGHLEQLQVAWTLLRRYGQMEGGKRLQAGTRRACEIHGCPEKCDRGLTQRWIDGLADALEADGWPRHYSLNEFVVRHPEFLRGDLFGRPIPN